MKIKFKFILAVLIGIVIGAAGVGMLSAQGVSPKTAPAYLIGEIEVTDPAGYKVYQDGVAPAIKATGGRFIVRGGKTVAFDGPPPKRIVMLGFDSLEKAQEFRDSKIYNEFVPVRDRSSQFRLYAVEGVAP